MSITIEDIQPGTSVKVVYGKNNMNNETRHIRAIVDGNYYVFRVWFARRWIYRVESWIGFKVLLDGGHIKSVKPTAKADEELSHAA